MKYQIPIFKGSFVNTKRDFILKKNSILIPENDRVEKRGRKGVHFNVCSSQRIIMPNTTMAAVVGISYIGVGSSKYNLDKILLLLAKAAADMHRKYAKIY